MMKEHRTNRIDTERLRALSERTAWPWLADAALDWLVIAAAMAAAMAIHNPLGYLLAVLVIGNRQHALAVLGHDGAHFTLSRSKWLNDGLTNLLAMWPLGLTVSGYRALHMKHHKETGTPEDPELMHKAARAPQWDLPASRWTVLRYALMDLIGYSLPDYSIIVRFSKPEQSKHLAGLIAFHALLIAALLLAGAWPVLLLWYGSLITSFMMFFRLRLWLEHQGTEGTQRIRLGRLQAVLLAPHNAWYHYEHHSWPTVPYHRLPELRPIVDGEPVRNLAELVNSLESLTAPQRQE